MRKRWILVALVAGSFAVAVGLGTGFVFAGTSRSTRVLERSVYLAHANAICGKAGKLLDRIPPIQDPTMLGTVLTSVDAALPTLKEQAAEIRALRPRPALQPDVDRFFTLTYRSIASLQSIRDAAQKTDPQRVAIGLIEFGRESTTAKRLAHRIGYRC